MNPLGLILLVAGAAAVIVGVRGTQSAVFNAFTGQPSKGPTVSPTGTTSATPSPGMATTTAPAPGAHFGPWLVH